MVFNWLHMAILVFFAAGFLMAGAALTTAYLISPRAKGDRMKTPYECGIAPLGEARASFHINYYVYALVFLAFEVDVLYLFPVALFYSDAVGMAAFVKLFIFLSVLALAVLYFWAKGVFRWPKKIS
jgi:NADH:ubiquinone oxidoreductase subunit 3 (subunit A)